MLAAHAGQSEYPKIRTFNKSDHSTNSVFKDLEAAEKLYVLSFRVGLQKTYFTSEGAEMSTCCSKVAHEQHLLTKVRRPVVLSIQVSVLIEKNKRILQRSCLLRSFAGSDSKITSRVY